MKIFFVSVAIIFSVVLQIGVAILFQKQLYLWVALAEIVNIIISIILYRTVPVTRELTHGLLELLHKEIALPETDFKIRCSILLPNLNKKSLHVHYRYPRAGSMTIMDISGDVGQGLGGRAFKSGRFEEAPDIPLKDAQGYYEFWRNYNFTETEAARFGESLMKSIYCWPIILEHDTSPSAVLSIDSRRERALQDSQKETVERFLPIICDAFKAEAQSGLRGDIEKILSLGRS